MQILEKGDSCLGTLLTPPVSAEYDGRKEVEIWGVLARNGSGAPFSTTTQPQHQLRVWLSCSVKCMGAKLPECVSQAFTYTVASEIGFRLGHF